MSAFHNYAPEIIEWKGALWHPLPTLSFSRLQLSPFSERQIIFLQN